MTTQTRTLADFLLARIAEDEERAKRASEGSTEAHWTVVANAAARYGADVGWHVLDHSPARVLAECEAKRRIMELHRALDEAWEGDCPTCGMQIPCHTLRALALPYVDHPDFRKEWRP